jgi:hypothetical protein
LENFLGEATRQFPDLVIFKRIRTGQVIGTPAGVPLSQFRREVAIAPGAEDVATRLEKEFGFTQDPDVLDTWFSSWLWPFATMGWPEQTDTLKKFYPTTDLVTGPDIIFFWVARMIMAGYEFMGDMPFRNVYFTGIIRDKQGRKMSDSSANTAPTRSASAPCAARRWARTSSSTRRTSSWAATSATNSGMPAASARWSAERMKEEG